MEKVLKTKEITDLYSAVLQLKTSAECQKFFRDLCTLGELKAMSERWQVAQQVNKRIPYREICKKTGSSTATITRVAHWLHHGMGGYKLVLDRTS